MLMAGTWMSRLLKNNLMDDVFNTENESFQQETRLIENEYAVATSGNAMTASASLNIRASASDKCEREFLFSPSSIVTRYMASKKSSECR